MAISQSNLYLVVIIYLASFDKPYFTCMLKCVVCLTERAKVIHIESLIQKLLGLNFRGCYGMFSNPPLFEEIQSNCKLSVEPLFHRMPKGSPRMYFYTLSHTGALFLDATKHKSFATSLKDTTFLNMFFRSLRRRPPSSQASTDSGNPRPRARVDTASSLGTTVASASKNPDIFTRCSHGSAQKTSRMRPTTAPKLAPGVHFSVNPVNEQDTEPAERFSLISPCAGEVNYVSTDDHDAVLVFKSLTTKPSSPKGSTTGTTDTTNNIEERAKEVQEQEYDVKNGDHSGVISLANLDLTYGGTLVEPFHASNLVIKNDRIYHTVIKHRHLKGGLGLLSNAITDRFSSALDIRACADGTGVEAVLRVKEGDFIVPVLDA